MSRVFFTVSSGVDESEVISYNESESPAVSRYHRTGENGETAGSHGFGEDKMKTVHVAAAVICDSLAEKKSIFATARGYGEYRGWWEFPGGKTEEGETSRQALIREIREELNTEITVGDLIETIEYDYPTFHLSMDCFWCEIAEGEPELLEAEEARWLTKTELYSVRWLPADLTLIREIEKSMKEAAGGTTGPERYSRHRQERPRRK
jgi:8-oxo-dGTP diphosphatase